MQAVLLGSIGTLADTSALQRAAYNSAFETHGLDWHWDEATHREMMRRSGGRQRIAAQAKAEGLRVDAAAIHMTTSDRFEAMLRTRRVVLHPGVAESLARLRGDGVPLGLVTTATRGTVCALLEAVGLDHAAFQVIVTADDVVAGKPASDCYHLAAALLAVAPENAVAVETSDDGMRAAVAAGLPSLAWPAQDEPSASSRRETLWQALSTHQIAAE